MPRTARADKGGFCYHVMNRGNAGCRVFDDVLDFEFFLDLIAGACSRIPMRILAYCLMNTHFHFALWPYHDGDLGRWMQWLMTAHVLRYHQRRNSFGHIWQGRFKAFPMQDDGHLLSVLRYIERNPVLAKLAVRAEDWQWSSVRWWRAEFKPKFLNEGPVRKPDDWLAWVNQPQTNEEVRRIEQCIAKGTPLGNDPWVKAVAKELGLESTLRHRGRS